MEHLSLQFCSLKYKVLVIILVWLKLYCSFIADYLPNNVTIPPIPPADTPIQSEDKTTPTFAYYIIGIGGVLLIIVLAFVIYCCARTCYLKWSEANVTFPTTKNPLYSVSKV